MIARRVFRSPHLYNQLNLSARQSVVRFPVHINRPSHLANPVHLPPPFRTATPFSTTITASSHNSDEYENRCPSKRTPRIETWLNQADELERLLDKDGFKTWGFVIYRCTYQSDSDWEKFMARFHRRVVEYLEYYNGLDLLDRFAPTVLEDPSFEGATVAVLRKHFNQWATTALKEEQGVDDGYRGRTGRYRFFVMVDQEAIESVLSAPEDDDTGFVRMVHAEWKPEVFDEEDVANGDVPEPEEPLEGCTEIDVGWMKMCWASVELPGFHSMRDIDDWQAYYSRPPAVGDIP